MIYKSERYAGKTAAQIYEMFRNDDLARARKTIAEDMNIQIDEVVGSDDKILAAARRIRRRDALAWKLRTPGAIRASRPPKRTIPDAVLEYRKDHVTMIDDILPEPEPVPEPF